MKKLFLLLMVAMAAISANAQTTFNIRAGVGIAKGTSWGFSENIHDVIDVDYGDQQIGYADHHDNKMTFAPVVAIEMNVPLGGKVSKWVFSPSVLCALPISPFSAKITGLVHFGYKFSAGNSGIFIPKIGFMGGYHVGDSSSEMYGPSCELAYETKHFVIAANAYYNIGKFVETEYRYWGDGYGTDQEIKGTDGIGAFLTFGYKF